MCASVYRDNHEIGVGQIIRRIRRPGDIIPQHPGSLPDAPARLNGGASCGRGGLPAAGTDTFTAHAEVDSPMTCAKCGNALQASDRFCGQCGTAVTVAIPPSPAPTAPRRGLVLALSGVGVAGGVGFLTYVRTTPVPFWVPPTPTPVPPTPTPVPPTPTPGPKRLVVDASGSGDYRTIASAILGARPQDTIVLGPGTYKESLRIDRDVRIVGEGGRSRVIVEGAPAAHVFAFTAGSATMTGLTIRIVGTGPASQGWGAISVTGGTPVIEDCDLFSGAGPAVYIHGAGANPVIRNCTIRNGSGSGVFVNDQGQGKIERCVISGNTLGGVQISTGGNPVVRDCEIRDGKQSGVFVWEQGKGTIERCVISGNADSGVEISDGGNPLVRDCTIRNNRRSGVSVYDQGQGTIEQCEIRGNLSGVEVRTRGSPVVQACEIRGNLLYGVLVSEQGRGTFTDNLLDNRYIDAAGVTWRGNRLNG